SKLATPVTARTTSDSEIIVHLYEQEGDSFIDKLDGIFAFVVIDGAKVLAARDPIGVKPLYWGKDSVGAIWFASEYKSLMESCSEIEEFPPGHYFTLEKGLVRWYKPKWHTETPTSTDVQKVRTCLE